MVSLGLYISKESFVIAEVSLAGKKPKIGHIEESFWLDLDSEEEKMELLSQKIQERERVHKGRSIRICCSLPQNFVSSFSLQLPFKERFKILKTIPFEVEDQTPFQSNKVLFDIKVCQIQAQNKTHILSFVTPEESARDFLQILQSLNRPIHLLSCSATSLANLLELWSVPLSKPQNPDPSIDTYLYLGIENSYLFFYKQGFLRHFSVLDWGCGGIVQEMQSIYKLSREKAWREFFNKAFLLTQVKGWTKEQVFFSNLVKKHTEPFIPKFNLLKMSLAAKKDLKISQVQLFGPGAMIKNFSSFLSDRLALSVYKSKHLTAFPYWDWRENPSALIAVGLTLEGLKRHPYPGLDFLHFQKSAPSLLSLGGVKNRALALLLALFVLFAYAFVKKYETDQLLEKAQAIFKEYGRKIAYLPADKIKVKEVESFLKEQDKMRLAKEHIQKELLRPGPMEALEKITAKIGSAEDWGLSLKYLKISGLNVEIKGILKADKLDTFETLIQSLAAAKIKTTATSAKPAGLEKTSAVFLDKLKEEPEGSSALKKNGGGALKSEDKPVEAEELAQTKEEEEGTSGLADFSYSFQLKTKF